MAKRSTPPETIGKYIIQDYPLIVLPMLAVAIGLNNAIVVQQLYFLSDRFEGKTIEGKRWIHLTDKELGDQFPFWSRNTIRRILQQLQEKGYVKTANLSDDPLDHTTWYMVDQDAAIKVSQSGSKKARKKRVDYPNFGQWANERKRLSKVETIDDPKLGQPTERDPIVLSLDNDPYKTDLIPETSKTETDPVPNGTDAPPASPPSEPVSQNGTESQSEDLKAPSPSSAKVPPGLYKHLENGRYEGPLPPTGKVVKAGGTFADGERLPADAVIVIPEKPAKASNPQAKLFDAWINTLGPDMRGRGVVYGPFMRFFQSLIKDHVTEGDIGCAALLYRAWWFEAGKPALDWDVGVVIKAIKGALALCQRGVNEFQVKQFIQTTRTDHFWNDKVIKFGYVLDNLKIESAQPGGNGKAKADPNCPRCHGDGFYLTPDDHGKQVGIPCDCYKVAQHG